jgi:hypothetical protein
MANGPFSDVFSDSFSNTEGALLPLPGTRRGLWHFAARHFAGCRHFWSAHFAGYEVEIEVIKPPQPSAGSKAYTPIPDHIIIVRIKRKDQVWEATYATSKYFAEPVIKITSWFSSFRMFVNDIVVRLTGVKVNTKKVSVEAKKLGD